MLLDIGRGDRVSLTEPGRIPQLFKFWFLEEAFGADAVAELLQQVALLALKRRKNDIAARATFNVIRDLIRVSVAY
jgi:hypothetical protein